MAYRTGDGPYRKVDDKDLRYIFYLTPQSGRAFMLSIKTSDFPGASRPEVTPLLRAMLYVLLDSPAQRMDLRREIIDKLAGRELISIQQKLLSHIEMIQQEPYLFAPCVDTQSLLAYY